MSVHPPAATAELTPGCRVRLVDTGLFVTIVPYVEGDRGTILQSCAMSGLWWVAFDRDETNPIRLPATAIARAEDEPAPVAAPAPEEATGLLDDLEPVPVGEEAAATFGRAAAPELAVAPLGSAAWQRGAVPLDAPWPAAPMRQRVGAASHGGDGRTGVATPPRVRRAFDDLH